MLAGVVDFFVGFLWYGVLFSNPWLRAMRREKNDRKWPDGVNHNMALNMGFSFLSGLTHAYFLVHALPHLLYGINGVHRVEDDAKDLVLAVFWLFTGFKLMSNIQTAVRVAPFCLCVCVCACVYLCMCVYVCMCVCVCVCFVSACVCVCVSACVCTHPQATFCFGFVCLLVCCFSPFTLAWFVVWTAVA